MAKIAIDEMEAHRFLETESLDKATVLFNIAQMRVGIHGDQAQPELLTAGKRRSKIEKIHRVTASEPTPGVE